MVLAAEVLDQSLVGWAVASLLAAGLTVLGFLVRNAFESTTKAVENLSIKLDAMAKDIARGDTAVAVLKRDIEAHTQRLDAKAKRLERLEARLERLEQARRDDSEGLVR
jgi:DNA repair ATPase RecN